MSKFLTKPLQRKDYLQEAFESLLASPHPAEAFGHMAGHLLKWFDCALAVLQVEADGAGPLFFQSGRALPLPGIAMGAEALLAEGEVLATPDLAVEPHCREDEFLTRAGFRSAARVVLTAGGRELGRFGLFAEQPDHFDTPAVQALAALRGPLCVLCQMALLSSRLTEGNELRMSLDEVAAAAENGILPALQACRAALGRLIPAAGTLAVVVTRHDPPVILSDRAGVHIPGTPTTEDSQAWLEWLATLPPEGIIADGVWAAPVTVTETVMGGLAVALGTTRGSVDTWNARLQPVRALMKALVAHGESLEALERLAQVQVTSLAAGVADEVSNLITEVALQADLLRTVLAEVPEAQPRLEALDRLVQKGTNLGLRLERAMNSRADREDSESLSVVIDRVCDHIRSYRGGKHVAIDKTLGKFSWVRVAPPVVEEVLTHLLLALAQRREDDARLLVRAHSDPSADSGLVLWLAEYGGGAPWDADLKQVFAAARNMMQRAGGDLTRVPLEAGAQALALRIPVVTPGTP